MTATKKGLTLGYLLVIITILIFYVFHEHPAHAPGRTADDVTPPPPKTHLDYIPIQENFNLFQRESDLDTCMFVPEEPRCKVLQGATPLSAPLQEGMSGGDGDGVSTFVSVLLRLVWFAVYFVLMLPEHILTFAEAMIWIFLTMLDQFIASLFQMALIFKDWIELFSDISKCGMTWKKNLPTCLLWYIFDMIIYVLVMIFVWIPILLVRIFSFGYADVKPYYNDMFGVKNYPDVDGGYIEADGFVAELSHSCYAMTGYEFMHFPDKILNTCYSCDIIGDVLFLFSDMATSWLIIYQYIFRDVGQIIPLLWHTFYLDAIFNPPEVGAFPYYQPVGGNLDKYKPPKVPKRLQEKLGTHTRNKVEHGDMSDLNEDNVTPGPTTTSGSAATPEPYQRFIA